MVTDSFAERMCGNKRSYFSRKAAKEALRRFFRWKGVRKYAYRCLFCGQLHIGGNRD
jgi:predicted restriction endonuclease